MTKFVKKLAGFMAVCLFVSTVNVSAAPAENGINRENSTEEHTVHTENITMEITTDEASLAIVTTDDYAMVHEAADSDSEPVGKLYEGNLVNVIEEVDDDWSLIESGNLTGYVDSEALITTQFTYGETLEEEKTRLAEEEQKNANRGQEVIDYAVQFVGNPYVYGGSSLTKGTDCSGFVMSVYKHFGVDLPHSSKSLRNEGYAVSEDEMQPGDIVCYSGHVALYMGDGRIVHASSRKTGIIISDDINYKSVLAVRRIF